MGLKPNLILEGNAYDKFYNSLKTKATRKLYRVALRKFVAFQKVENVNDLLPSLPEKTALINAKVIDWIVFMRDIEQIAPRSVTTYLAGVPLQVYLLSEQMINTRTKTMVAVFQCLEYQ